MPFLKWAGGKARLAPRILAEAPQGFNVYHEPFAGAAAVFFALRRAGLAREARLADANEELIACFAAVRDDCEAVIRALQPLASTYIASGADGRRVLYYARRAESPTRPAERAARLIFLNQTCYNGLYRVNSRGEFNVPHGRYPNPRIFDSDELREASRALQGVELEATDFATACAAARPGDFVYLDPPYYPLTATARFTSYTTGSFGHAEHVRLRDAFDDLTRRGVAAMLSNSLHPCVRELYGRYRQREAPLSRAISSRGSARQSITELLIDNLEQVPAIGEGAAAEG